jgi:lipoprotein-anchoring transpeptidase ErfK/SrfK
MAMRSFISPLTILPAAGVAGLLLFGGYIFLGITAPVTEIPPHGTGPSPKPDTRRNFGPLNLPLQHPHIVINKSRRELLLFDGEKQLRRYKIGLGKEPVGDKIGEGDMRTPEGDFYICVKNANSKFYLSLGLSYPNVEDAERGLRDGLITTADHDQIVDAIARRVRPPWDTKLGGEIFIHGNGSSSDWTWGCVAVEDSEIKELFDAVPMGTPVRINH